MTDSGVPLLAAGNTRVAQLVDEGLNIQGIFTHWSRSSVVFGHSLGRKDEKWEGGFPVQLNLVFIHWDFADVLIGSFFAGMYSVSRQAQPQVFIIGRGKQSGFFSQVSLCYNLYTVSSGGCVYSKCLFTHKTLVVGKFTCIHRLDLWLVPRITYLLTCKWSIGSVISVREREYCNYWSIISGTNRDEGEKRVER